MSNELIQQAFKALEEISLTGSTTTKNFILSQSVGNEYLRKILYWTYNPFLVYNVKKLPPAADLSPLSMIENYRLLQDLLDQLRNRDITGNRALEQISIFLGHCSPLEEFWYSKVIKKDLKIGIKAKSINSAMPELIPEFNVMLAASKFRSYPQCFIIQPKFDGMRCITNTSTGEMFSRKGKLLFGFDAIAQEVMEKFPKGLMVDGEIMVGDTFRGLMRQAFAKIDGKDGILNAFDVIPENEFFSGKSAKKQIDRLDDLYGFLGHRDDNENVVVVHSSNILYSADPNLQDKIDDAYNTALSMGLEGLMVKDIYAYYEGKRGYDWQKIKPADPYDVKVLDLERGRPGTKYEQTLGKLVVDYKGNIVRVGSAISDAQRDLWWHNPQLILGKTIEILGQEVTENLKGTNSIRCPRFSRIHPDKN